MSPQDPRALYPLFPAAPMVLGRMTYDDWACTPIAAAETAAAAVAIPGEGTAAEGMAAEESGKTLFLRSEEDFWRQASALLGERYRQFAGVGFSLELGRISIASEARPDPAEGPQDPALRTPPADPESETEDARLIPPIGRFVRIRRSNGFVEERWVLARLETRGRCLVQRGSFTKFIDLVDLMILNPELVPAGTPVRVPRSSGALDSGWEVSRIERGLLIVSKPGLGRKGLTPEQFFAANPKLVATGADEAATSLVEPQVGSPVRVRRSNGEREPGWVVADHLDGMEVPVQRETAEGVLSKAVPLEELLEDNPQLIPPDLPLRVMRSSGALDDGWLVTGLNADQVRLERPDIGEKEASARDLIAWNRDRLLDETSTAVSPVVASPEGLAQAAKFRDEGRLAERIVDGYWDGAPMGGRPALVVHRGRDMALAPSLAFARELAGRPAGERLHRLAEIVWQFMGEAASSSFFGKVGPRDDQGVLLGDAPRMLGAGSSLARAMMFSVLASEAGLAPVLMRGELVLPGVRGGHVWCEVKPAEGETLLIDLSMPPPPAGYDFPPAEHPAIRACYVPGGQP